MGYWIKGPKMRDVVAYVKDKQVHESGDILLTVWWHNTGRAMGLPVFPMYANKDKPAIEQIRISPDILAQWERANTAEELL